MDNMSYIIFICIAVPMLFTLPIITDRMARRIVFFVIVGVYAGLLVSEINGNLLSVFEEDYLYVTTMLTPITEEIVKALPVMLFAYAFSDNQEHLVSVAFALGIGFAILENMVILLQNVESVTLLWALIRGFGSALMHGICTGAVGIGMHYIHRKKKLFLSGTFSLLILAMTYHSIYNTLVQSRFQYIGFLLPVFTFILLLIYNTKSRKKVRNARTPSR